ncbi:hypothetical protein [Qiania dongpingensis]|uniref:Uncharacterized protein n=1 Tax=Qiania dongpingensis TaxID=2763669 RepID=A0A7G9G397_9FIRM|nr:hypothetical protein [Qiania dongpingensis]QNM05279.1 hypothetical protein H9Q78_12670 [Qiania dongpingensis]
MRQSIRWLTGCSQSEPEKILEETVNRITACTGMDYFEDGERRGNTE